MSAHDREVLDLLRDEPELLAIADAVADTQRASRTLQPFRAIGAVALAVVAIFVLVLAAPWDRGGGGRGTVLDRAFAAVGGEGPVVHMMMRMDANALNADGQSFSPVITETFYDKQAGLVRAIARSDGKVIGDYTSAAAEDEFSFFPGLLQGAAFYRQAVATGDARIVGKGVWEGTPVYWLELDKGGGLIFRIGIARDSYRPVVFRALNPDGTNAGAQVAVLGFDYVSRARAAFATDAPVLATGRVVGPDCRGAKARVDAFLGDQFPTGGEIAATRTGPDGRFVLTADPRRSPIREALAKGNGEINIDFNAIANKNGVPRLIGFYGSPRVVKDGRWVGAPPVTLLVQERSGKGCSAPKALLERTAHSED
jgi:hypothetical protein